MKIINIQGNDKDVVIECQGEKWHKFFDKNHKGGVKDKALMLAAYKKAIAANKDLSPTVKATLMQVNVTDL